MLIMARLAAYGQFTQKKYGNVSNCSKCTFDAYMYEYHNLHTKLYFRLSQLHPSKFALSAHKYILYWVHSLSQNRKVIQFHEI